MMVKCVPIACTARALWALLFLFVVLGQHLMAQDGSPDPAFQVQQMSPGQMWLQSDGKIQSGAVR